MVEVLREVGLMRLARNFEREKVKSTTNDNLYISMVLFLFCQVTPSLIPSLTDEQLSGLGVTTIGDKAMLRAACQSPRSMV